MLGNLQLRYIGGRAPADERMQTEFEGLFRVDEFVDVREAQIERYRSDLDAYTEKVGRMTRLAADLDLQRAQQAKLLARQEKERLQRAAEQTAHEQAERVVRIEREKAFERRKLEAEALHLALIERKREKREKREAENWPSYAIGKLPMGAWLCQSQQSAARLFSGWNTEPLRTTERSLKDCNPSTRVVFFSSMETQPGGEVKVHVFGSGELYADPAKIETSAP